MHILIADDDELFALMIEQICKIRSHTSSTFYNGRDAVDSITDNCTYDAAILDAYMPHLNGDQVYNKLAQIHNGEFPTLFCTGLTDPTNWARLQKYGHVMNKSTAIKDLANEMEKLEEWVSRIKNGNHIRADYRSK